MTNQEKGLNFEKQCFLKLVELGFVDLSLTKNTDNGADIIGTLRKTKYVFQCKDHNKPQGNRCVQEIIAAQKLYRGNRSVVLSKSSFTPAAIALAKANNCILVQAEDFFELSEFPPKDYSEVFLRNDSIYDFDYRLIEKYEEIKKQVGRTPKWDELNKSVRYLIVKKYKNYGNFLLAIGDDKSTAKHTDDELRKEYIRIKKLLNKVPTGADIRAHSLFPYNQFHQYPLSKLQKECGDRPNVERGVSKEELKRAYFNLETKLGHTPTVKEIDSQCDYRVSYYRRRWGSMDAFFHDIGLTRTSAGLPRSFSQEELVVIYSLVKILLSVLKEDDNYIVNHTVLEKLTYDKKRVISPSTFSKRFGSWKEFRAYIDEMRVDNSIKEIVDRISENGFSELLKIIE